MGENAERNPGVSTHVDRLSAGQAVYQRLREEIEAGTFPVGTRLPAETRLAERYGVSRPVVREALRSCATLGLTDTRTGSGTWVIAAAPTAGLRLGRYSAGDLHEARPHIEIPAAGLAAERRTAEDVERLRSILAAMADEQDPRRWVELDGELHLTIARASGNKVFASVIADIREAIVAQSELLNITIRRQYESHPEHESIVDAIEHGQADKAKEAMSAHLSAVAAAVGVAAIPDASAASP